MEILNDDLRFYCRDFEALSLSLLFDRSYFSFQIFFWINYVGRRRFKRKCGKFAKSRSSVFYGDLWIFAISSSSIAAYLYFSCWKGLYFQFLHQQYLLLVPIFLKVEKCFPGSKLSSVGSLIFLRYICPGLRESFLLCFTLINFSFCTFFFAFHLSF